MSGDGEDVDCPHRYDDDLSMRCTHCGRVDPHDWAQHQVCGHPGCRPHGPAHPAQPAQPTHREPS